MEAILKSHSILADAEVTSDEPCESNYSHRVRCVISQLDDRYRCYIHLSWGHWYGEYFNEDSSYIACVRGDSISEVIDTCRADLTSDDKLTYETKQAMIEAHDEAEEHESSGYELHYE